ncbi:MAG: hypothetical protein IKL82_00320 [Clostridia bacterium]|nr:hypothetical protein [Clostridia bacterium]
MKKVNVKLLVGSIIYALFTIALWLTLNNTGVLSVVFSQYFFQYLIAFPFTASVVWFGLFGLLFALVSTVGAVFGILKAVGVLKNNLGAKLLQKLGKVFCSFAIITCIWFAFYIFMATAPSGAPDADDIKNMASGLVPLVYIIIVSICGNIVNKNVKKAIEADEAAAKEAPVEVAEEAPAEEVAE